MTQAYNNYSVKRDGKVIPLITTVEAKRQLSIAPTITEFDALIDSIISAATEFIEDQTNHYFKSQPVTFIRGGFPPQGYPLFLPVGPVNGDILSFNYNDEEGNPQPFTDYELATRIPPRVDPAGSWPSTAAVGDAVTVKFNAGYPDGVEPAAAIHAVSMLTTHWFVHRSETEMGSVSKVPLAVESLINSLQTGQDYIGF